MRLLEKIGAPRESADWIPIHSEAGWPAVACAGCGFLLRPTSKRRGTRTFQLVIVKYCCEPCEFETFRTVKDD